MDRKRQHEDVIERYGRGENVDISSLPEPTQDRLRAERATREKQRADYESSHARKAQARAEELRVGYLASGGTPAGWDKEGPAIVTMDRAERARAAAAEPLSLIPKSQFLN